MRKEPTFSCLTGISIPCLIAMTVLSTCAGSDKLNGDVLISEINVGNALRVVYLRPSLDPVRTLLTYTFTCPSNLGKPCVLYLFSPK